MEKFYIYLKNRLINDFQFNENDLNQQYSFWIETRGDNKISKSDFYWSCLNLALTYYAKNSKTLEEMYNIHREINLLMLDFLQKEKRNYTHIQKEIIKLDIFKGEIMGFEVDIEILAGNNCNYAKAFNGQKISLETALNNFPIQFDKCDRPAGCSCRVFSVGKRNSEGRLILKK